MIRNKVPFIALLFVIYILLFEVFLQSVNFLMIQMFYLDFLASVKREESRSLQEEVIFPMIREAGHLKICPPLMKKAETSVQHLSLRKKKVLLNFMRESVNPRRIREEMHMGPTVGGNQETRLILLYQ